MWDTERLRIAADVAGIALWSWNVDTDEIALDERARGLWKVLRDGSVTFEELYSQIHPADLARAMKAFTVTREMTSAYEIGFRTLHGDAVR